MSTQEPTVECVSPFRAGSGECPVWSVAEGRLYWVDQEAETLNCFDPTNGDNIAWPMPALASAFGLRGPGQKIVVSLRTGIFDFDPKTGSLDPVAVPAPYPIETHRFNDGRCDRQGRFWVGSVDLTSRQSKRWGTASVYRLDDRGLVELIDGISCTNGLAFSPDGMTMYLADTPAAKVYAFDYDVETGTPSNRRDFVSFGPGEGAPDGAEVDSEGGYWVAMIMGNAVARYRPDGTLDRRIPVPVLQPTKVAFGGADLTTMYLTSASHRHLPGDRPLGEQAGGIFAIETGFTGLPEPHFAF